MEIPKNNTYTLVRYSVFAAFVLLLGLTPLGFINLPFASITMVHIPVIVAGYFLGIKGGAWLGLLFGLTSLIRSFLTPDATSVIILGTNTGFGVHNFVLVFAILFLPRVLCGLFAALTYKAMSSCKKINSMFAMAAAAFVGTLTNTVFYLGGLYITMAEQMAQIMNVPRDGLITAVLGIVSFNGLIEAAAAIIICTAIGKALQSFTRGKKVKA